MARCSRAARLEELARLERSSRWSLEIRVSLDGHRAAEHDAIRGPGTFERALDGLGSSSVTACSPSSRSPRPPDEDPLVFRRRCLDMLRAAGLSRPRIKLLPLFRIGRERARTRGYEAIETWPTSRPTPFDPTPAPVRLVPRGHASRRVRVPVARRRAGRAHGRHARRCRATFRLAHGACYTCYVTGMTCANG